MADGFNNTPSTGAGIAGNIASNVSGVFSTKPSAKYLSGARVILKINQQVVGFAFGITWNINTTVREVNTIDNYLPYELVPQRLTIDGTISALHIPGISATTNNWQSDVLSFLFQPYVSIEARDSATDQLLFATDRAMIVGRSEEVRVDQLSSITLRFRAIGFQDEKDPSKSQYTSTDQDSSSAAGNSRKGVLGGVANALNSVSGAIKGFTF